MSTTREPIYLCTLTTRTRRISRPVLAWDEREAALVFREQLEDEGAWRRGKVEVHAMLGSPTPSTSLAAVLPG